MANNDIYALENHPTWCPKCKKHQKLMSWRVRQMPADWYCKTCETALERKPDDA